MEEKSKEKIYMDQLGYEKFLDEIKALGRQLVEIDKERKNSFHFGTDDAWDSAEFLEVERDCSIIASEINRRLEMLKRIVIVQSKESEDVVDINDLIRLNIIFDENDNEEMIVKLVGNVDVNKESDITEISVNSPLGSAIYGKQIGTNVSYNVNQNTFRAQILEKVQEKQDKNDSYQKIKTQN